ncbi:MAG: ATPase, T2SS/T4P/T4SS family [Planctomycetota bacterium]|jgi:pilus assembly protein CpaF
MRVVVQDTLKNKQWVGYEGRAGFTVGREDDCTVCLDTSKFVSRRHLQVERGERGWAVEVLDRATPVTVDGQTITPGAATELKPVSEVRLAEFVLTLIQDEKEIVSDEDLAIGDINALQRELHGAVLTRLELRRSGAGQLEATDERLEQINGFVDELLHGEFRERLLGKQRTRERLLGMVYENRLLAALSRDAAKALDIERVRTPGFNIALEEHANELVDRLVRRMELKCTRDSTVEDVDKINTRLAEHLPGIVKETPDNIQFYLIARFLKKVVCDMVFGLGPLQDLLDTPAISEIMIVSPEQVYVERAGTIVRSSRTFLGDEALMGVIERIVAPLGRRIDMSTPLVDARLSDGSRVNAIIPPLALKGPCLTIRRFPSHRITPQDLVDWGSMTDAAYALLEGAVRSRKNIVVAGGTGSGKTTLLNVLSSFIPEDERIVTIEDSAELQLDQEHLVSLETRPPNVEGKGGYTIRDLVKNALRMRPDRIIVGEVRGAEAFDMLQAMNTGHDGSLTTVHANSAIDVVSRLETMCLAAAEIPVSAIRRQVTQATDLIVFIRRFKGGKRMVCQVAEVMGIHPHTGEVEMRDVMAAVGLDEDARLRPTGYLPTFLGDLVDRNLIDLDRWFGRAAS